MKTVMMEDGECRGILAGNKEIDPKTPERLTFELENSISKVLMLIPPSLGISWPTQISSNYDSSLCKTDYRHIVHLSRNPIFTMSSFLV